MPPRPDSTQPAMKPSLAVLALACSLFVAPDLLAQGAAPAPTAPAVSLSWPPILDTQNPTTVSVDGRKIERYIHGGRPEWGYPANAAWPYPPLEKFESTMQNNNSFYLVSPKVPRDDAPLRVAPHS